jgi:hypothetical protein
LSSFEVPVNIVMVVTSLHLTALKLWQMAALVLQGNPVSWNPSIHLWFCSMAVDSPFEFQTNILCVDALLFLFNTQFYFLLSWLFISLIKVCTPAVLAIVQVVACLPMVRVAGDQFPVAWFFKSPCLQWLWRPSNFIHLLMLCIYLFYFLLYSHLRMRGLIWDYYNCLFLEQCSSLNCFFKSFIFHTANVFYHMFVWFWVSSWNLGPNL